MKKLNDEVLWAQFILYACSFVGSETLDKVNRIIKQNPKDFPWETKYDSIPKKVHEAFDKELNPDRFSDISSAFNEIKPSEGLQSKINSYNPATYRMTADSFSEMLKDMAKMSEDKINKQRAEEKRYNEIWKKHYGPYGLQQKRRLNIYPTL